jgi:hypothetical protein
MNDSKNHHLLNFGYNTSNIEHGILKTYINNHGSMSMLEP